MGTLGVSRGLWFLKPLWVGTGKSYHRCHCQRLRGYGKSMSSRSLPSSSEVVVVGAGLAGLAAAGVMQRAGRDVIVLEASDGVGGRVRTDFVDGFRLDRGFQVLLTSYPELQTQVDLDGLDLRTFEPGAVVFRSGRFAMVGDPLRAPSTTISTLTNRVGSISDKLKLLRERIRISRQTAPQLLRQPDVSTTEALADRGYSDDIVESFFRPFVGGIQLDPTLSTSQRIFDVILRALYTGQVAVPAKGMGALSDQLGAAISPERIHLDSPVSSVSPGEVQLANGHSVATDRIIVATEGPAASELLGLDPVESNPATCVWFAAPAPPVDHRYIVLDGTGSGPALNIATMTNVAPEYSSNGDALIAAACPGLLDDQIEPSVRAQMRSMWGPQVDQWRHVRTDAIPHGQPSQAPPFHPKQRVSLGDGLFVCGDHRDTASLQGALFSGRRCAEAVLDSLT